MNIKGFKLAICIATGTVIPALAQTSNWQNKDLQTDGFFGISTEKAYAVLLKGKKAKTVIVGIVDSGVDTLHEDLKSVLWSDPKTGHHGWNYIGPETGQEDVTKLVGNRKAFYDSLSYTVVPEQYRKGYQAYRRLLPQLEGKISDMQNLITDLEKVQDQPNAKELIKLAQYHLEHGLNVNNDEADTAKGNEDVSPDKIGPLTHPNLTPIHGTHVAGIIGAQRNNGTGMDGIADHVQILMLKTNGNIRELRDKNLAKAIRFATDHGAKVINMSFGKPYTRDKEEVDDAVKYAMKKDVLLIHAAGNSGENLDNTEHYPNPNYLDGGTAKAWIEVGASGAKDDDGLVAKFSNYGGNSVDVFAPGVQIYSTIPGNKYSYEDGTSMATPVVAGLAALIREYYPKLTAVQVKDIIMKSVVKRDILKEKCVSGGVVNAFSALKLAATY